MIVIIAAKSASIGRHPFSLLDEVACAVVARVAIGSLMLNYILASKKRCITPDADIQLPGKFDIDKLCFFITT